MFIGTKTIKDTQCLIESVCFSASSLIVSLVNGAQTDLAAFGLNASCPVNPAPGAPICAWCFPQIAKSLSGPSVGICRRHYRQMLRQIRGLQPLVFKFRNRK